MPRSHILIVKAHEHLDLTRKNLPSGGVALQSFEVDIDTLPEKSGQGYLWPKIFSDIMYRNHNTGP